VDAKALPLNGLESLPAASIDAVGKFFAGWFGAHRFYTGHILIGVIQLLTFGACGVWTIVDLILILTDNYRDANGYPLVKQ
jgi:TM2 domain-containing membrane protein YozV